MYSKMPKRHDADLENWPAIAVEWLAVEREYQDQKFGEVVYCEQIANGVRASLFGQTMGNYAVHADILQQESMWLPMLQRVGKIAAGCRGAWVATEMHFGNPESLNNIGNSSLERACLLGGSALRGLYAGRIADFWETPLGRSVDILDDAIVRGDAEEALIDADAMLTEAMQLFGDKIETVYNATGKFVLPQPGLSTGNIEPWLPVRDQ
jgi:hypothetical protein